MTPKQTSAWLAPVKDHTVLASPQYAQKFELDGVKWETRFAILVDSAHINGAAWYLSVSGYNHAGKIVPVTNKGDLLWNRVRTQIAANIADEEFKGVGARKPDGSPDVHVVPGKVAWHFYLPLSGEEAINFKSRGI